MMSADDRPVADALSSLAHGTVGGVTIAAGTGFTFTSDAADTSTYEYEVR